MWLDFISQLVNTDKMCKTTQGRVCFCMVFMVLGVLEELYWNYLSASQRSKIHLFNPRPSHLQKKKKKNDRTALKSSGHLKNLLFRTLQRHWAFFSHPQSVTRPAVRPAECMIRCYSSLEDTIQAMPLSTASSHCHYSVPDTQISSQSQGCINQYDFFFSHPTLFLHLDLFLLCGILLTDQVRSVTSFTVYWRMKEYRP